VPPPTRSAIFTLAVPFRSFSEGGAFGLVKVGSDIPLKVGSKEKRKNFKELNSNGRSGCCQLRLLKLSKAAIKKAIDQVGNNYNIQIFGNKNNSN